MIQSIERISLTAADAATLARFYIEAIGFRETGRQRIEAAAYGVDGQALAVSLVLGQQEIELVQFDRAGAPYPADASSHDPIFQHIALVTTDIRSALARLTAGMRMISRDAPVALPASSGGVTAAKFRDPEGHPLEFLQFPKASAPDQWRGVAMPDHPCIGIDHSALVATDTLRSIRFYSERGLSVTARTINTGPEQDRLDGVQGAEVEVTALSPAGPTPHVELLRYRSPMAATTSAAADADVAATRLIVRTAACNSKIMISDPDGHRMVLLPAS